MNIELSKDRCKTGIPGFDELCEGGFDKNSINAILGGPGAGKTTFLLQFLWNGINLYNEKGLFVSFETHDADLYLDALHYGWDFFQLENQGKLRFLRFSPQSDLKLIKKEIERIILRDNIKRVCMDPISVLSVHLKNESLIREIIYDMACTLKRFNITTLLADETSEGTVENFSLGNNEPRTESIKFLCDGLVNLYSSGLGGESDRAIRITKMRRTDHVRGPVPFKITKNGIIIYSRKK